MRVSDRCAVELQTDPGSAGIELKRRHVEAYSDGRTARREEEVANDGRSLELRDVRRRNRRGHAIGRLRLPDLAGGVDIGAQLRVEEAVDQAAGREQLGEIVERRFERAAGHERKAPVHGQRTERRRSAGAVVGGNHLLTGAAAAQSGARIRHRL